MEERSILEGRKEEERSILEGRKEEERSILGVEGRKEGDSGFISPEVATNKPIQNMHAEFQGRQFFFLMVESLSVKALPSLLGFPQN